MSFHKLKNETCSCLNGGQVQSCVNQISGGADEPDQVAEARQPVVATKSAPVGFVLGVLLSELSIALLLAAQANLVPQAVLLLHPPHLEHHLSSCRAEPLSVQTRHDQRHEVQEHLHAFMPVQQLSGVVHGVHSQVDKVTSQQAVEVQGEELTLHETKGVSGYLPHQRKTCDEGHPDLHAPGEREHQEVQYFDQVGWFPLRCHGVTLQNTDIQNIH